MDLPVVAALEIMEQGYSMPFVWDDNHQARVGVMDRSASADSVTWADSITWIDIDPCYVFHPLNSYDDGEQIIMDVVQYQTVFTDPQAADFDKDSRLVRWTIDADAGTTLYHDIGEDCAAGEPIFVPAGDAEDEGYILSLVYCDKTRMSEVRVIDAQDFSSDPVAIVKLGTRIPFGFHGIFVATRDG